MCPPDICITRHVCLVHFYGVLCGGYKLILLSMFNETLFKYVLLKYIFLYCNSRILLIKENYLARDEYFMYQYTTVTVNFELLLILNFKSIK